MAQSYQSPPLERVAFIVLAAGCAFDSTQIPVTDSDTREAGDSGEDATVDRLGPDGRAPVPEAGADASTAPAVRHIACGEVAFSAPDPGVITTALGRPEFDLFRDIDCAMVEGWSSCADFAGGELYLCVSCLNRVGAPEAHGVCLPDTQNGCIAAAHGSHCVACVPPEAKARACCLGLSIDCRGWPFDGIYAALSQPGQLCARHADCEPGLLCRAEGGLQARYGVCVCPEQFAADLPPAGSCLERRSP